MYPCTMYCATASIRMNAPRPCAHGKLDEGIRQVGRLAGQLDRAANGRKKCFLLRLIFRLEQRQDGVQEGDEVGPGMSDGFEVQAMPPEMP